MLEPMDLKAMGFNSTRYIHALYQVMNLAFADRDFYYGDPDFPPEEPRKGLLSKDYAHERAKTIDWAQNDAKAKPGDPYAFQGGTNPYQDLLAKWPARGPRRPASATPSAEPAANLHGYEVHAGDVGEAADEAGSCRSRRPAAGTGVHRGEDRHRDRPGCRTCAGLAEGVQRARAGQAPARDVTTAGAQGRQPSLRWPSRAATRRTESPAVLRQQVGSADHAEAVERQHHELPDAPFADHEAIPAASTARRRPVGPPGRGRWLLPHPAARPPADQRDLLRPRARNDVGRVERLQREPDRR